MWAYYTVLIEYQAEQVCSRAMGSGVGRVYRANGTGLTALAWRLTVNVTPFFSFVRSLSDPSGGDGRWR